PAVGGGHGQVRSGMTTAGVRIVKPGLLTTVQDLGRGGHQLDGVPGAGPVGAFSPRLANHLVGNEPEAATLEITLIGPELIAEVPVTLVVCGADFDVSIDGDAAPTGTSLHVRQGQAVRFGKRHSG